MLTVVLLICSNMFMTIAWYGHLKFRSVPLIIAILLSWSIALLEYCFQVPANRYGYELARSSGRLPRRDRDPGPGSLVSSALARQIQRPTAQDSARSDHDHRVRDLQRGLPQRRDPPHRLGRLRPDRPGRSRHDAPAHAGMNVRLEPSIAICQLLKRRFANVSRFTPARFTAAIA